MSPGFLAAVNDMVEIIDSDSASLMCRLGRVMEVSSGDDCTVRVAKVLTSNRLITGPVVKALKLKSPHPSTGNRELILFIHLLFIY
ncbi:DUF5641 domain-containing protein [Aphis craccivora]|uniref:DUF5641 domain-containing protein n=1 Tax=Aphis craccivora TaxID=307492 RepID=A0A6G0Z6N7_APHCR|nr:DUF5641 domain-containing protein [Aphis craccivora]